VCSHANLSKGRITGIINGRKRIATAVVNRIVTVNCIHIAVITTIMQAI
jgi:hypothetical protein